MSMPRMTPCFYCGSPPNFGPDMAFPPEVVGLLAELADARALLGLAMNRISGERGTINHDLNKRIADFLILKREYRPSASDAEAQP
jgi:hypothetical protein